MPQPDQVASLAAPTAADRRRWKALGVLALIQFMLSLDITVVNIALPQMQRDLGFSSTGLAWVVNAYVLMAGGLLLLGGRTADFLGRRRIFLIGVGLFAIASAACGAATDQQLLVGARFVQGSGEALAAPAALGLIAVMFTDPTERMRALGIAGGITALGGVFGTVIGGIIVNFASWRWAFFINLPIAALALLLVPRLVSESRMQGRQRPNPTGAIIGTVGLIAIVDGLLAAATHPWGSWQVILPLLGGMALLGLMVAVEARSRSPLIPLDFFANRTRVVANFVTLFLAAAFISYFFLLTLYEQQVLGYSPLQGGLSYLTFGVGMIAGIGIGALVMPRVGVKSVLATGFFGCAVGLWLISDLTTHSTYWRDIAPGMFILAFFAGIAFPALNNAALHRVTGEDSSLASGVQISMQQIGGAIGLSCLVTLALRHAASQAVHGVPASIASTHGYDLAWRIGAVLCIVGGVMVILMLERVSGELRIADPVAELEPAAQ